MPVKRQANVLYVNLERDAASMARRLANVNEALGLPRNRPLAFQNARGKTLTDTMGAVEAYVKKRNIELVMLDSISRSGFGDLNENRPVNAIMDALNGVAKAWMAIAHTPRADETHVYGSQMFEAAADVMIQMTSQEGRTRDLMGVALQVTKANDIPKPPMRFWGLEFAEGGYGLKSIWSARESEFPTLAAGKRMSIEEGVLAFLEREQPATVSAIHAGTDYPKVAIRSMVTHDNRVVRVGYSGKEPTYGIQSSSSESSEPYWTRS